MPLMLVDANYLRSPELLQYLAGGPANRIALSEHVMIEQHKSNPRLTIENSFRQARNFPRQVVILKSIPAFYASRFTTGREVRRMSDAVQSRSFAQWYDDVLNAENHSGMQMHLAARQADSVKEIEHIAGDVKNLLPVFRRIRRDFTNAELSEIRALNLVSAQTQHKLINTMTRISRSLFEVMQISWARQPHDIREAPGFYLFRYAMCIVHLFIRWVHKGNLSENTDKLVNHIMDMQLAAQATFYHGILTNDRTLADVHRQSRWLIGMMRGYRPT